MSYTPTEWVDYPSTTTPITAARLNNMEAGIAACDSAVTSLSGIYSTISWAIIAAFPEITIRRLLLYPTTTPTLLGEGGYFDLDTTQYDDFDYTVDGMLIFRNDKLVDKPGYIFAPIENGVVVIGDNTYTSDVTTGVRVKFINLRLDSTDKLYVELFIKPEGGSAAHPAGEAIHQLDGGTFTIAGHAEPIATE